MSSKTHDFHLVNPSALPIQGVISLFVLAVGAILLMHDKALGSIIFFDGVLFTLYTMYSWWKTVIDEGDDDKAHTHIVQHGLRMGMILFIVSEVMFFGGFFASFFKASLLPVDILGDIWPTAEGTWPPEGIETFNAWGLPLLNTLILLTSSFTVSFAHHAVMHNKFKEIVKWLAITIVLGLSFTCLQAYEYYHAAFGFTDGIYASNFYMATGFHGLHVIVGTIFLIVCFCRARRNELTKDEHLGLEFASWYWHFVDAVWIFLFVWVYWWGA